MSKRDFREFYEKYIMSEDEKMMQIIHENARKGKIDKSIEQNKNKRKKAVFVSLVAFLVLLVIVIGVLWTR